MQEKKNEPRFHVTDRRFWVQDESVIDQTSATPPRYPSFVEELKARTELAEQKLKEKVRRLEEENEAFRSRLAREMEKKLERDRLQVFKEFLEVVDNLERALEAAESPSPEPSGDATHLDQARLAGLQEGVRLNLDLFLSKLRSLGIEPIDVLHQPFDPHEAEAVGVQSVHDAALDQRVVAVVQRGFRYGDQLLRPARVRVGRLDS